MGEDGAGPSGAFAALASSPLVRRSLFAVALSLGIVSVVARISFIASPRGAATDFSQDYLSARAWSDGIDPYTDTSVLVDKYFGSRSGYYDLLPPSQRNPHPPIFIVLNRALSGLSFRAARITWLVLSAFLTAVAMGWFLIELGVSRLISVGVAIGILAVPVVQTDLVYGQSNGILLVLLLLGWLCLRRNMERTGGIALGFATALKLFPALLIIPLLLRRRWRAAASQVASAIGLTTFGALFIGVHSTREFFTTVSGDNLRYWRAAPMNLSLISIPFRWLTHNPWRVTHSANSVVASGLAAALFLLCVLGMWKTIEVNRGDSYWLVVPWLLLATPIVWETYLVLLLPLTTLVVMSVATGKVGPKPPLYVFLGTALVLIGLPPGLPSPIGTSAWIQLVGYQLPTYGVLLLALSAIAGKLRLDIAEPAERRRVRSLSSYSV